MIGFRARPWLALLPLLWIALIVSLYFVIHKPIDLSQAARLGLACWRLLAGFLLLSLCGGLGAWVYPGDDLPALSKLAVQAALGLGMMGVALLVAGAAGGFHLELLLGGALLLGILLRRPMRRWLLLWKNVPEIARGGGFEKAAAVLVGFILVVTLARALAPPIKFDALVYHLTLPQTYVRSGGMHYIPWLMFWGMPQTLEMLYTAAMALGGGEAAAVFGWWVGVTAAVGTFAFTRSYLGPRAAWVAIAGIFSGLTLAASLAWGYVEWGSILMGVAFLVTLAQWNETGSRRDLILAGLFAGLATAIKYTSGVLIIAGLGVIILSIVRKTNGHHSLAVYAISALLGVLPWLVKNLLATGNPFYPFFFEAGAMDSTRLELFQGFPVWGNWRTFLALPFEATILGVEGAPGFGASIGPLFLGFCILFWIGWKSRPEKNRRVIAMVSVLVLIGVLVWALAGRFSGYLIQTRLYLALIPAIAFLAGAGFDGLDRIKGEKFRPGRVAAFLVLVVLGLNVFNLSVNSLRDGVPAYVAGLKNADSYLFENLGWHHAAVQEVNDLPDESKVLMLWEPRSYYCRPVCQPDEVIDRWLRDFRELEDEQRVVRRWQQQGYSHVLLHRDGMEFVRRDDRRYTAEDWAGLEQAINGLPLIKDIGGSYQLYSIVK
ncbi:MAG: hypothetical protein R3335_05235 [Anaerolineales bacterium]|nr:hypothetical protein [Anaerolineales bacterium]